jgi:hypothetical protein
MLARNFPCGVLIKAWFSSHRALAWHWCASWFCWPRWWWGGEGEGGGERDVFFVFCAKHLGENERGAFGGCTRGRRRRYERERDACVSASVDNAFPPTRALLKPRNNPPPRRPPPYSIFILGRKNALLKKSCTRTQKHARSSWASAAAAAPSRRRASVAHGEGRSVRFIVMFGKHTAEGDHGVVQ